MLMLSITIYKIMRISLERVNKKGNSLCASYYHNDLRRVIV